MTTEKRYCLSPKMVWREVEGEAVILDLAETTYYSLNETGTCVLKRIVSAGKEGAIFGEILSALQEEYEAESYSELQEDVRLLVEDLVREKIILIRG